MTEVKIPDKEAGVTVKHSVGFWAAVIMQWFYAIGAGALALFYCIGIIALGVKSGENLAWLVVLPWVALLAWTAWLSGKLARNIQSGILPPSASLSQNWGSALTLTIVVAAIGILGSIALRQAFSVQEKARVSEAVIFIRDIASKQKTFSAKYGRLPSGASEIGPMPSLKFFTLDYITFENNPSQNWVVKLTRNDLSRSSRYGNYAIVYNSSGTPHYDCVESSNLNACRKELISIIE